MPEFYGAHGLGFGLTMTVHFLLEGLCAVAFLKSAGCEAAWLGRPMTPTGRDEEFDSP